MTLQLQLNFLICTEENVIIFFIRARTGSFPQGISVADLGYGLCT